MPGAVQWRRFEELWPSARLPPTLDELRASALAVDQGAVGDCYFLGPLSALAFCRPQLVRALFVEQAAGAPPTPGRLALRFYVHGAWAELAVDTLLPCGADGDPSPDPDPNPNPNNDPHPNPHPNPNSSRNPNPAQVGRSSLAALALDLPYISLISPYISPTSP